jgi:hypothetical protein
MPTACSTALRQASSWVAPRASMRFSPLAPLTRRTSPDSLWTATLPTAQPEAQTLIAPVVQDVDPFPQATAQAIRVYTTMVPGYSLLFRPNVGPGSRGAIRLVPRMRGP